MSWMAGRREKVATLEAQLYAAKEEHAECRSKIIEITRELEA